MKTAGIGAAGAMGAAARPVRPSEAKKFGAPVSGPDYRIGEVTVPLPAGRWRLITVHQGVNRRGALRVANHLLADIDGGRIRALVALSTNLDESNGFWYSREQRACASSQLRRDYFFVVNNAKGADPVTCWRFTRFSWSRFVAQLKEGGIDKQSRFRNRVAYFLKDNVSLNFFYGFWVHASVKGRFVRALYAFNRARYDFENKLWNGKLASMRPLITQVAERIQADLVAALRGKAVDGNRFRAAIDKVR